MADAEKQKEVNDFKAKAIANAKQQKAKKSQEAKQAAAKEKEQEKAERAQPTAKAKVQVQKSGSAAASSAPRASLAPGALTADQVNRAYYEAVQHDQDTILRHLGKQFASEAALAIGNVKEEGGIQALPVLHCRFHICFLFHMCFEIIYALYVPTRSHSAKINARRHCRTMARTLLESMPFGLTTCEAQHLECHYKEIK